MRFRQYPSFPVLALSAAACLVISFSVNAGGLYLYEIATEDTGLAGAGQAARAADASTLVSNPAGLTRLPDRMLTGGLQALYGHTPYQLENGRGSSPGNTLGWFPGASLFWHQRLNESWSAGLGLYGNYGLGLDFGDWAGARLIKKSTLMALTLSPALAWKISDRVSWGAGIGINYGFLSLTRDAGDGDEKQHDHDWAMNFRTGLLFDITEQTRAGISYTSKTEYHFSIDGTARLPQFPGEGYTLPLSAQVNSPAQLMLSAVHDISTRWSVMGDLGWQDWSGYGANQIYVSGNELQRKNKLKDTWHAALGLQFRPDAFWRLNSGIAYDSSFYRSQGDTSLTMPSGDAWRFGAGAQYQLSTASNIGMAVEYLTMDTSRVSSGPFRGSYDNPSIWFVSLNYSQQF